MYVKRRLVPFGEVIPFRSLISKITSLTALQPQDFTPGHVNHIFAVGQIRLGDVICYEIGFDDLVRSDVAGGANLLTMQTNDATFERDGQTGETGQQLAMARIRAVEYDRAVVVASTTGYSAIVAPDGNLITSSGTWQQAELEARVPLISYTTLADRVGAWPEWAIVGRHRARALPRHRPGRTRARASSGRAAARQAPQRRRQPADRATARPMPRTDSKLGNRRGPGHTSDNVSDAAIAALPRTGFVSRREGRSASVNVCRAASRRAPRLAAAALTAVAALLVTACQGSTPTATKLNPTAVASKSATQVTKYLQISPAPGTKNASPADGITVTADPRRQDHRRHRQDDKRARRHGHAQRRRHQLAHQLRAAHRLVLHGDRQGNRRLRPPGHRDEQVHHADAGHRVPRRDLRGRGRHLRGGHADHADLRPPDHQQGGRRAGAHPHHVQPGDRRLVLGRRPAARLPAAGLLARQTPR